MDASGDSTPRHLLLILGCTVLADGSPSWALRRRVQGALELWRSLAGVRFLAVGGARSGRPAEASVIERLLREGGVPGDAIVSSPVGENTIVSLRACWPRILAAHRSGQAVHLCTDGYHALRCRMILRLWGVSSRPAPPPETGLPRGQLFALRWRDRAALLKDVPRAVYLRAARKLGANAD